MTQEEKQLLLVELCARLPYKLKVKVPTLQEDDVFTLVAICEDYITVMKDNGSCFDIYNSIEVFPFLRPMSSMTEEECKELGELPAIIEHVAETLPNVPYYIEVVKPEQIDYLNANHFDYRDLISKGLALEAPKDMYK